MGSHVPQYLIWSNQRRGWWKQSRHGYTTRTDRAGRFAFNEARQIVNQANEFSPADAPPEIMLPAPSRDLCALDMEFPDR